MQTTFKGSYHGFPYPNTQKRKSYQLWSSVLKIPAKRQRFFKNKHRLFSVDYGRSLPKRLFWQVSFCATKTGWQQTPELQRPWFVFRYSLLGKPWILSNPSLVPGIVWPVKRKKYVLSQLRAWKGLCHLLAKGSQDRILARLQKLWTSHSQPALWNVAAGLDSLKTSLLLKGGFVSTLPAGFHGIHHGRVLLNGFAAKKTFSFVYPGDWLQGDPCSFARLFNGGPLQQDYRWANKQPASLYTTKVFYWLLPFYRGLFFKTSEPSLCV